MQHDFQKEIVTERLILRLIKNDDLEDFSGILADPLVMKYSLNGPFTNEQTQNFLNKIFKHYKTYGYGLMSIAYKESNKIIGYCGLINQVIDNENKIELGYRLDSNFWNKGIATEAAKAVIKYAYDELKLQELISIIEPENIQSIRVTEKVGMKLWKETIAWGINVNIYRIFL